MNPPRPWIVPMSRQSSSVGLPSTKDTTVEGAELARAYDRACYYMSCVERRYVDLPPDGFEELAGAVREFAVTRRADGAPPERVLAAIKGVLHTSCIPGAHETHGDGLQALILREFLASYYGALAPASAALASVE